MARRLGLFLCVFVLAGCSGFGTDGAHREGSNAGESAGAKALPVQSYILTDEQREVVHRAAQRIANACMKKQGFDDGMPDMFEPKIEGLTPNFLDRRYSAVDDEKTARKYGLHVPLYVEYPRPPVEPELSEEASEALWGPPDSGHIREEVDVSQGRLSFGGCAGQAEAALSKGMKYVAGFGGGYAEPVRMLNLDGTADEDPRVKAAQAAWSACMAEGGYRLTSTMDDERKIPGVDLDSPVPSKAEIEVALWEVKCQKRTKVVDIWFEAESEYQRMKIDQQAEVFAEIKKENDELIQRAADVLGEETP